MARLKQCPELTPKNGATASLDHRIATQNRFFEVSERRRRLQKDVDGRVEPGHDG